MQRDTTTTTTEHASNLPQGDTLASESQPPTITQLTATFTQVGGKSGKTPPVPLQTSTRRSTPAGKASQEAQQRKQQELLRDQDSIGHSCHQCKNSKTVPVVLGYFNAKFVYIVPLKEVKLFKVHHEICAPVETELRNAPVLHSGV